MAEQEQLSHIPTYDSIVERNKIEILQEPGDLVLRNGDIAVTRWGDLMLVIEDYSAFVKLVETWRFNYPTLKVLFAASIESTQRHKDLEENLEGLFSPRAANPTSDIDYDAYHRTNDAMGAAEVARGVYAGSIVVVVSNMLQTFRANIGATQDEWKNATPIFFGCSVGQILEASANNVRHAEEWQTTRPPTPQQMKSIWVLSAALQEPLTRRMVLGIAFPARSAPKRYILLATAISESWRRTCSALPTIFLSNARPGYRLRFLPRKPFLNASTVNRSRRY